MGALRVRAFGALIAIFAACTSETPDDTGPDPATGGTGSVAGEGGAPIGSGGAGGSQGPGDASTVSAGTGGMSAVVGSGGGGGAGTGGALGSGGMAATAPPDADNDGVLDADDNCKAVANQDQADRDDDGAGDACDNCPSVQNADQADADSDKTGDACECENPVVTCASGMAGPYPCSGVDMLSRIALADLGARSGNAIWGGVESKHKREIAVVGLDNATAFVDVSVPGCPVQLGRLPSTTSGARSGTHDVKTSGDYALIVAEIRNHGLQVFDMRTLGMTESTATLTPLTTYRGTDSEPITNAHDVLANEATGFVYVVGASSCGGGLHMVDFHDPSKPTFAGCGKDDHYVHDAQCVVYKGPDEEHTGKEICVTFNGEDSSFSIVDVTDKSAPHELSTTHYDKGQYTHNGALTDDHSHLVLSDELDEQRNGNPTRTFLFDVTDLDKPTALGTYDAKTKSIDHNLFIRDDFVYQANYEAGLHILDASKAPMGMLSEVAFFDTFPTLDAAELKGAWTAYPYFPSGIVVMNGTEGGVFVLRPQPAVFGAE